MSKPSYVCVTCGEDFTRKPSAERHKANPNIHSNGNCIIVRFIEYVIGIANGTYREPSMLPSRLSSIKRRRKNRFVGSNKNIVGDKVSTFPDLSKNAQSWGNEPDRRTSKSNPIEGKKHEEGTLDYCIRIASRTLELRNLLEELSRGGQRSPVASSQYVSQKEEGYEESAKPTLMDGMIDKARKLVKFQHIIWELYNGRSSCSAAANAFCVNPSLETETVMLDRKEIFGFSAKECRDCISFEIVPQHFDTGGNEGFHQVPHRCQPRVILTHNLYQNILYQNCLYQNRKNMVISSKKLIEFWTESNVGMCAIDISNHTGESLVIKHPESDTKLIRVPVKVDTPLHLDLESKAHEHEEKESNHWFHKVVGKNQIVPVKRSDLVKFLIKTNGSSYGIFTILPTVNSYNAEHLGSIRQSKIYFVYLAKYRNTASGMVGDDYYSNHDSNATIMEEQQDDERKEDNLNIVEQPRNAKMLIAIVLAMYITGALNLRRPLRDKEDEDSFLL
jgi:hypothetical protein